MIGRRGIAAVGLALVAGAVALLPARPAPSAPAMREAPALPAHGPFVLGVQTHFSQGWPVSLLARAREVHARAFRDSMPWSGGEREHGTYAFDGPRADALRAVCAGGGDLVLTLDPVNKLYDDGATVYSDSGRAAFAAYVSALLDRFGTCIAAIEVGNEINGAHALHYPAGTDPAAAYVALLRTLRAKVKPKHPEVAILGGSTNEIGTGFLVRLFRAGALGAMDGVAVHPYRAHAEGVDVEVAHLGEAMRREGAAVPIWATEFSSQYPTAEVAAPELIKMVALLSASGVSRAYWYALVEEPWFRNMGLFDDGPKPAADAFRIAQEQLLPAGRAVRVDTGDRDTYLFRFGADRWVAWGASRAIRFTGAPVIRDLRGRAVAGQPTLGAEPLIVTGATGYTLGPSPVVADSLLEYGGPPWSYLARTSAGKVDPLGLFDDQFDSYFGSRFYRPLRIGLASAAPAGDGDKGTRAVLRYTADRARSLTVSACFRKKPAGDGVDIAVLRNGQPVRRALLTQELVVADLDVDLGAGDTLDFVAGPNRFPGNDTFGYRVRLLDRGSKLAPLCP